MPSRLELRFLHKWLLTVITNKIVFFKRHHPQVNNGRKEQVQTDIRMRFCVFDLPEGWYGKDLETLI
jgi:hypothetical protein